MIDRRQFRSLVIRPALKHLDPLVPYSTVAEDLLLGTALVESRLQWLRQVGGGPALGVYQVEPATHDDVWNNYLRYRGRLRRRVLSMCPPWRTETSPPFDGSEWWPSEDLMVTDLAYATAIARLVYRRAPELLPRQADAAGMARYHKRWYNTPAGATDVDTSVHHFQVALTP